MSSEVSVEAAFSRVRLVAVGAEVDGWEALGKAVSAESEPIFSVEVDKSNTTGDECLAG